MAVLDLMTFTIDELETFTIDQLEVFVLDPVAPTSGRVWRVEAASFYAPSPVMAVSIGVKALVHVPGAIMAATSQ